MKLFVDISDKAIYICIYKNTNDMNKEQILDFIRQQEQELYAEYLEIRKNFDFEDNHYTRYAAAQWNAVLNILEKIEENENN